MIGYGFPKEGGKKKNTKLEFRDVTWIMMSKLEHSLATMGKGHSD